MTTSQTPFLSELAEGHFGVPIPMAKRAYFQQRLRIRIFNFLLEKFVKAQGDGLNKTLLAKRIGKTPDLINRWLGQPSNLTIDTISDLLLGIAAEELEPASSSPLHQVADNYSLLEEMASASNPPAKPEIEQASARPNVTNAQAVTNKAANEAYTLKGAN